MGEQRPEADNIPLAHQSGELDGTAGANSPAIQGARHRDRESVPVQTGNLADLRPAPAPGQGISQEMDCLGRRI